MKKNALCSSRSTVYLKPFNQQSNTSSNYGKRLGATALRMQAPDAALDTASLVDLPIPLLSRILNILPDIRLPQTLATLASLSRAFASAVKQQQSISLASSELTGLSDTFTIATQASLFPRLQYITNLDLEGSLRLLRALARFASGLPAKEQPLSE
ncbi:hypothetical protein WJX82_010753 [Trebouxia sp. C0006]